MLFKNVLWAGLFGLLLTGVLKSLHFHGISSFCFGYMTVIGANAIMVFRLRRWASLDAVKSLKIFVRAELVKLVAFTLFVAIALLYIRAAVFPLLLGVITAVAVSSIFYQVRFKQ